MTWPHLLVFCLSKDNSTGHSEQKKDEVDKRSGKTMLKSRLGWTLAAVENRTRWNGTVVKSFVVPQTPCKVMGLTRLNYSLNSMVALIKGLKSNNYQKPLLGQANLILDFKCQSLGSLKDTTLTLI